MASKHLPQEIFDAIIDQLHSDTDTLKTCSLVCKSWLPSARRHLFATFKLFISTYHHARMRFVESHSSVIPFIRHLHLKGYLGEGRKLLDDYLPKLVDFVGVRLLSLSEIPGGSMDIHTTAVVFSNVVSLSLDNSHFDSFTNFAEFICALPSLQTIRILRAIWRGTPISFPLPVDFRLPRNLQNLDLDLSVTEDVLNWLLSFEQTPTIRSYWHKISPLTEVIGERFFRAMDNTLEKVYIEHPRLSPAFRFYHSLAESLFLAGSDTPFDLSCNTQLCFIHFGLSGDFIRHTQFVTGTLLKIVSNQIEEVSFNCFWSRVPQRDPVEWSWLDMIFAQPQFSRLRKIRVCIGSWRLVEAAAWLEKRLPGCHARGILYFTDRPVTRRDCFLSS